MSGLGSGEWPFAGSRGKTPTTNSENHTSHKAVASDGLSHNNTMTNSNNNATITGNNLTNMVFHFVVQSPDSASNDTRPEISKSGSGSSNGNEGSVAPLIKLTNVDSEYTPHLEQPVELSDSRPSGKSEEKPSLENTPATSSENVFVRGDSDDRGDMYDIVSDLAREDKPVPEQIKCKEMRLGRYLPKETEGYIKRYMSTPLFDSSRVIPLYYPSPNTPGPETWARHVCMGDVGFFNSLGGFTSLFNIFETKAKNISLGYRPPASFRPFYLTVSEVSAAVERREPPMHHWMMYGLEKKLTIDGASGTSTASSMALWVPPKIESTDFSAIYMENGYTRLSMQHHREMEVLQYLRDEQPLWKSHFDQNCPIQFQDLSLAVILATYRAETWTLAAGTKRFLETKKDPLTLEQLPKYHDLSRYIWKTNDRSIRCEYGPKEVQLDTLEQYLSGENPQPNLGAEDRRKIRECHCVGVRACILTKPKSRIAASISSLTSSKSTIRSRLQLHMSMPN